MVGWGAVVVAATGLISLGTGLEVVPVASAGALALPAGVAAAGLLLVVLVARADAGSILLPLVCGLVTLLAVGAVATGAAFAAGGAGAALGVAESAATRPFVAVDALAAAAAGLVALVVLRGRRAGAGRPRWPWEDPGEP